MYGQENDEIPSHEEEVATQCTLCEICARIDLRRHFWKLLELREEKPTDQSRMSQPLIHELLSNQDSTQGILTTNELSDGGSSEKSVNEISFSDEESQDGKPPSELFSDESSSEEASSDGLPKSWELRDESTDDGDDASDVVAVQIGLEEIAPAIADSGPGMRFGAGKGQGADMIFIGTINSIQKKQSCSLCRLISRALSGGRTITDNNLLEKTQIKMTVYEDRLKVECGQTVRFIRVTNDDDPPVRGQCFTKSISSVKSNGKFVQWPRFRVETISSWLKDCEIWHENACGDQASIPRYQSPVKLRLVDVKRKCLVCASSSWKFFALSYVWGKAPMLKTTQTNKSMMEEDGALDSQGGCGTLIPHVITDAMQLVALLGERYLWVDSLCIVQDEADDKHEQIAQMDVIYSQAAATIVQLSGASADVRLSRLQPSTSTVRAIEVVEDVPLVWTPPSMKDALKESVYESRAWTLQERLLSKRIICFSDEQVYFSCRSGYRYEDENNPHLRSLRWVGPGENNLNPLRSCLVTAIREDYGERWYSLFDTYATLVSQFSSRTLSFTSDVLNAFSGLRAVLQHSYEANFISGLPEALFDIALHWTPASRIHRREQPISDNAKSKLYFPSWCWTGWVGGSSYSSSFNDLCKRYNELGRLSIRSEVSSFTINHHGKVRNIERVKICYHDSPDAGDSPIPLAEINQDIDVSMLLFWAMTSPAGRFRLKFYDISVLRPDSPPHISFVSKDDKVMGYLYDGGVLESQSLDDGSLDFVLLSRVSRPFYEWSFFQDMEKFKWDIAHVMLVRRTEDSTERVAFGYMHINLWKTSSPIRKLIKLV